MGLFGLPFISGVWLWFATGFWLWMVYDCVQRGRTQPWLYLLIFTNVLGALLYFFTFKLSELNLPGLGILKNRQLKGKLWEAKANARAIGKAHQYVVLGDLYYEMRKFDDAKSAFATAIEKEPKNINALWGATQLALRDRDLTQAKQNLKTVLDVEPEFLRGDASLAYARVLVELEDWQEAKDYLPEDLRRWGHPETYVLMAEMHVKEGEKEQARELLEGMVTRVKGGYDFYYKQHKRTVRRAEKLLRSLG